MLNFSAASCSVCQVWQTPRSDSSVPCVTWCHLNLKCYSSNHRAVLQFLILSMEVFPQWKLYSQPVEALSKKALNWWATWEWSWNCRKLIGALGCYGREVRAPGRLPKSTGTTKQPKTLYIPWMFERLYMKVSIICEKTVIIWLAEKIHSLK